jgi:hypothetical protein
MAVEAMSGEDFRRATEEVLCRQGATGEGVILGRGGAVVLRDDEDAARDTLRRLDRAHAAYLKQFYGVEIDDPSLYHLQIDSTAIATAARFLTHP